MTSLTQAASSFSTATNIGSASPNGGAYCGGIFRLSSSYLVTTGGVLPSEVRLNMFEIQVRPGNSAYQLPSNTCLQIVKLDGDATVADFNAAWGTGTGNAVYTSAALGSVAATGTFAQFDFGGSLTLSTTQNYAFRFVTATPAGDGVTYTTAGLSIAAYMAGSGTSFSKDPAGTGTNMGGPTLIGSAGDGVPTAVQGSGYIANIRVNTSVPEPATATLGLLGLASLMLRRRRAA